MNYIADNLKYLRNAANLSQTELADELKLNRGNISSYERGISVPSIKVLQEIVDYFNVDFGEFIEQDLSKIKNNLQNVTDKLLATGQVYTLSDLEEEIIPPHIMKMVQEVNYYNGNQINKIYAEVRKVSHRMEELVEIVERLVAEQKKLLQ